MYLSPYCSILIIILLQLVELSISKLHLLKKEIKKRNSPNSERERKKKKKLHAGFHISLNDSPGAVTFFAPKRGEVQSAKCEVRSAKCEVEGRRGGLNNGTIILTVVS